MWGEISWQICLKEEFLDDRYPQEYSFTGNIGVIGHFSEVASPVKASLGNS
jgi:hypothetical protein